MALMTLLQWNVAEAQTFRNCKAVIVKYPNGVAINFGRIGTSGAEINRAIYLQNQRLDRDKDGVICENELKQNPTTTTTTIRSSITITRPSVTTPTTIQATTTTTTIRATTTTFPTLVETTIFGRPFLSSSGNWILPNIELAPGFTATQAYVNGSWVKVNYSVVNESFGGASARVADTFGFNVLFRHIQELYNSSRGQYEIVRIWYRSPSVGY